MSDILHHLLLATQYDTVLADEGLSEIPWFHGRWDVDRANIPDNITVQLEVMVDTHPTPQQVEGFRVSARQLVSSRITKAVCGAVIRDIWRKLSPYLYEIDPRIGFTLLPGMSDFPRSFLFDPDAGNNLYPGRCVFCTDPFTRSNIPMWGGGNVMWVHKSCWLKS